MRRVNIPNARTNKAAGFTFIELIVLLGVLAPLGLLVIPALASGKSGSHRAVCVNNLSRIARALAIWDEAQVERSPRPGVVTAAGTTGSKIDDTTTSAPQRFYRVLLIP